MTITVNGKVVCLKEGTSFDYVSENRYFSGADNYTMSIELPIKGCPQNIAVFGHTRMDSDGRYEAMDCVIQDRSFVQEGVLTVVSRDEVSVRCQFLAGRSKQNFASSLADIYITDLDLGMVIVSKTDPAEDCKSIDDGKNIVVLPWVNNTSGNLQDAMEYDTDAMAWKWKILGSTTGHPYLIYVARKICEAVGYSYTFDPWENDDRRYLVLCNCVPYAWSDFQLSTVLPRWSVQQFFSELEDFLEIDFDIDEIHKTIVATDRKSRFQGMNTVLLEKVVDEFSSDVSDEDQTKYIGTRNLSYVEGGHHLSKFYSCQWFIDSMKQIIVDYDNLTLLRADNLEHERTGMYSYKNGNRILHDVEMDDYYILYAERLVEAGSEAGRMRYWFYTRLLKINEFCPSTYQADSGNTKELHVIPAWLDDVDGHACLFLECGEKGDFLEFAVGRGFDWRTQSIAQDAPHSYQEGKTPSVYQSYPYDILDAGEQEGKEYFSNLYVGYWNGVYSRHNMPHPKVSHRFVNGGWVIITDGFTMKLDGGSIDHRFAPEIDFGTKYHFSFLSKTIPDFRSIFYIAGKKYLCEKITATFSERGMSELLKGEFYRIS